MSRIGKLLENIEVREALKNKADFKDLISKMDKERAKELSSELSTLVRKYPQRKDRVPASIKLLSDEFGEVDPKMTSGNINAVWELIDRRAGNY